VSIFNEANIKKLVLDSFESGERYRFGEVLDQELTKLLPKKVSFLD
jgi:hypothetical protein